MRGVVQLLPLELRTSQPPAAACSSGAAGSSPSSDPNFNNVAPLVPPRIPFFCPQLASTDHQHQHQPHNLELQLLPSSSSYCSKTPPLDHQNNNVAHLKLSIGREEEEEEPATSDDGLKMSAVVAAERVVFLAKETRREAKREIEMAEVEFENAKRIRQEAQAEVERAQLLKEQATRKLNSTIFHITCHACKKPFQASTTAGADETTSLGMIYLPSPATTE